MTMNFTQVECEVFYEIDTPVYINYCPDPHIFWRFDA